MNYHPQCSIYSIINTTTVTFRSQDSVVSGTGWKIKSSNPAMDKSYNNIQREHQDWHWGPLYIPLNGGQGLFIWRKVAWMWGWPLTFTYS